MRSKSYDNPPVLSLTMGDPAGIGPEIAVKALSGNPLSCRAFIIGDASVIRRAQKFVRSGAEINVISSVEDLRTGMINVLDMKQIDPQDFSIGKVSPRCGQASYAYILKAISLAKEGSIDGVVTNPINKEALRLGGIGFPGHTEIFAHETATETYTMMFILEGIAVVHVTTHCSLKNAIEMINTSRVLDNIRLLNSTLTAMYFRAPHIAVAGLNPHAGEHGLFGTEEIEHIIPAVERARSEGIDVSGPYPPDTVFMRAFGGEFNGIVSMIHDHGFVALKSRNFQKGVNVTVGLPIVRTSVGHGTAFDIAGTGEASDASLLEAVRIAVLLAAGKKETG